jgi:hypothetical protein
VFEPSRERIGVGIRAPDRRLERKGHPIILSPNENRWRGFNLGADRLQQPDVRTWREFRIARQELEGVSRMCNRVDPAPRGVEAAEVNLLAKIREHRFEEGLNFGRVQKWIGQIACRNQR